MNTEKSLYSVLRTGITKLVGANLLTLLASLGTNSLVASVFGATFQKDALDASIAIPRNIFQTFALGSLGGSTLYLIGRREVVDKNYVTSLLLWVGVCQFAYSLLFFIAAVIIEPNLIQWFAGDLPLEGRQLLSNCLSWTKYTILLRPIVTLLGSAAAGMRKYGTMQLGNLVEKVGSVLGLLLVGLFGAVSYPIGTTMGVFFAVMLTYFLLFGLKIHAPQHFKYLSTDLRDALRISGPWMVTAPFTTLSNWILIPIMIGLGQGIYASYGYALALNSLMMSVVLVPLTDAFAPILAGVTHKGTTLERNFGSLPEVGLKIAIIIGVILLFLNLVLARPLVAFAYFHGNMDSESVHRIAQLLSVLSLGLIGRSLINYTSRLFQAKLATLNSVMIQAIEPVISLGVTFALLNRLGVTSVAWGASVSAIVCGGVGLVLARRSLKIKILLIPKELLLWAVVMISVAVVSTLLPFPVLKDVMYNFGAVAILGSFSVFLLFFSGIVLKVEESVWLRQRIWLMKKI